MKLRNIFTIAIALIFQSYALAATGYQGVNLSLGLGIGQNSNEGPSTDQKRMSNFYSIGAGSTHKEGLYIGFDYEVEKFKGSIKDLNLKSTGASIGFTDRGRGMYIIGHYFWSVSKENDSGTNTSGTGAGYDIGYQYKTKNMLSFGFQYSGRTYSLKDTPKFNRNMPLLMMGLNS